MFSSRETPRGLHGHLCFICVSKMLMAFLLPVIARFGTILRLSSRREKQTYLCLLPVVREVVRAEGAVGGVVLHLQGPGVLGLVLGAERALPECGTRICACLRVSARAHCLAGSWSSSKRTRTLVSVKSSRQPTRVDTHRDRALPPSEAGCGGWGAAANSREPWVEAPTGKTSVRKYFMTTHLVFWCCGQKLVLRKTGVNSANSEQVFPDCYQTLGSRW